MPVPGRAKADWVQSDRIRKRVGPEQPDSFALSYTGSASLTTSVSLVSPGSLSMHQLLAHADSLSKVMAISQITRYDCSGQHDLEHIAGIVWLT